MKRCTKCILPETFATIEFDKNGVCNICKQMEIKEKIDWDKREKELIKILEINKKESKKRKNKYDCIVPFGGGKDSSYTLYILKEKYGMNPLAVSFNIMFLTDIGKKNFDGVLRKLGVDNIMFSPDIKLVRKLCLESLKKNGDWCWYCHAGIFAWTVQMAIKLNIPLMVFGESSVEYRHHYSYEKFIELDKKYFTLATTEGIVAKDFVSENITINDLKPFIYPSSNEIKNSHIRQIYISNYIKWDTYQNVKLIKDKLNWQGAKVEGSFIDYDKVDCKYVGVRDYLKFIKRNYGRSCQLASIEIRNGRMTREDALKVASELDGHRPKSLDDFLQEIGITEEEFMKIANKHIVHK